jgi:predicted transcriptional regulator
MSARPDIPSLEALAESLAGTFPGSDDGPLARALLRELSQGEPASAAALAACSGRDASLLRHHWRQIDEASRV